PPSILTSVTTTRAPSLANIRAAARPCPPPAPVINATLPASLSPISSPQNKSVPAIRTVEQFSNCRLESGRLRAALIAQGYLSRPLPQLIRAASHCGSVGPHVCRKGRSRASSFHAGLPKIASSPGIDPTARPLADARVVLSPCQGCRKYTFHDRSMNR